MKRIFVNLKRFDVPSAMGGICPADDPGRWAEDVIEECAALGLGRLPGAELVILFPEALALPAVRRLRECPAGDTVGLHVGVEGVFREDVRPGANFGAFTTNLPAAAAANMGCTWAIVGHSEERRDKLGVIAAFEPAVEEEGAPADRASGAVDRLVNAEVLRALERSMNVLLCMGETAHERGGGTFEDQKPRMEAVLHRQVERGLAGVRDALGACEVVIGYEPIWAIGPGKTPPGADYIGYVSTVIKRAAGEVHGLEPAVVYGGGLKVENAAMLAGVDTIDGGLVALTRFTPPVAFEPDGLKRIMERYLQVTAEQEKP